MVERQIRELLEDEVSLNWSVNRVKTIPAKSLDCLHPEVIFHGTQLGQTLSCFAADRGRH